MFKKRDRAELREIRHARVRKKISGTPEMPRLSVYRSLKHIQVQLIDDVAGKTLCSASTMEKSIQEQLNELDSLMEADVLLLDDLGSEPLMENITIVQLFNLINERQTAGKGTVISTNLNVRELRERYTERIASRLTDKRQCTQVVFMGDDIRRI